MKSEQINPTYDWVLVEWLEHEGKTDSGLVLAASAGKDEKFTCRKARVLKVGPGGLIEGGALRPMRLDVGDVVLTVGTAGRPVAPGSALSLMREAEAIALVSE